MTVRTSRTRSCPDSADSSSGSCPRSGAAPSRGCGYQTSSTRPLSGAPSARVATPHACAPGCDCSIPPRYRAPCGQVSGLLLRLLTMSLVTFKDLCIDVNDSRHASEFWARTLGLELTGFDDSPDEFKLVGPTPQHTVWTNVVPEPHTVKNRVHLDVFAPAVEPFTDLRQLSEPGQFRWTVFADPEDDETPGWDAAGF